MNKITTILATAKTTTVANVDSLKIISRFLNFMMHPGLILQGLWNYTLIYSFWICLFVAMFAVVFYALGFKKFAKFIPGSIAVYTLIRMLGSAF